MKSVILVAVTVISVASYPDINVNLWLTSNNSTYYDTFTGKPISTARVVQLRASNLIPWCAQEIRQCHAHEPRRLDNSCNNLKHPLRGTFMTPFHRMLPPNYSANGGISTARSGNPLPNARKLRVDLMSDGRVPSNKYTHLLINWALTAIGDTTTVHDTLNYVALTRTCCMPGGDQDPRCIPIYVPDDDLHLRRSNIRCLNLTRAYTYQRLGCVPDTVPGERVNAATPMLDASYLYGNEESGGRRAREYSGGRLRADNIKGKDWPPDGGIVCINNRLPNETRCHNGAISGTNTLVGINALFILIFRQHNYIARQLESINPCWNDEQIFLTTREIIIAFELQILYYEVMPVIMGYDYLKKMKVIFPGEMHVDDYDETLEPRISIEYVIGNRWFHSMQEGRINLYDRHGKFYNQLLAVDLTVRTGILPVNNTLEGITQGFFRQASGANDYIIDPDMGERSLGPFQQASDVMTSDIMKGRDMGLPPYNEYRKLCKLPVAKTFHDLYEWIPVDQVNAIRMNYESVDDVDLMAGIIAERPMAGGVVGPTLACIMTEQLLRWRRADRFWFESPKRPMPFTKEQLKEIRQFNLAKFICDHGDEVDSIQPHPLLLPGPHNPIIDCSRHKGMSLEPWRDSTCAKNRKQ